MGLLSRIRSGAWNVPDGDLLASDADPVVPWGIMDRPVQLFEPAAFYDEYLRVLAPLRALDQSIYDATLMVPVILLPPNVLEGALQVDGLEVERGPAGTRPGLIYRPREST